MFYCLRITAAAEVSVVSFQGNIVAIKYTDRKRVELNRKVLFELKHVSRRKCLCLSASGGV